MFRHIMIPTDGSGLSTRAATTGIELAKRLNASVFVFHVIAPFHTYSYMMELMNATEKSYTEASIRRAEQYLGELRQAARSAGVTCHSNYAIDDHPYAAIINAAKTEHCDLIVMASHGWRGFKALILGSETHKVLTNCEIPVLVCR